MTLGDSAGRSRRNPTGSGAVGRSAPRVRAGIEPPVDGTPVERFELEPEPFPLRQLLIHTGLFIAVSLWIVFLVAIGVDIAT